MAIWLVTIGSSDIQLTTDDYWGDWYRPIKASCRNIPFIPKPVRDDQLQFKVEPRALGAIYSAYPDEIWSYLKFPLLQEFTTNLQSLKIEIDKIIVLLTDQSAVFSAEEQTDKYCPYWQDTITLQPILNRYLSDQFPMAEVQALCLQPEEGSLGLDDWNQTLTLVQQVFSEQLPKVEDTVYVSHQAGTPAISSAVQFASLAYYRQQVEFWVSNEYRPEQTRSISSSTYLSAIRRQEAKALLKRRNYVAFKEIIGLDGQDFKVSHDDKELSCLLEASIQWNFAEFQKFKKTLSKHPGFKKLSFPWWQSGYESAYLALVRLVYQGDTVEALFHSFRAIEGSIVRWIEKTYPDHVERDSRGPQLKISITDVVPSYFESLTSGTQNIFERFGKLGLYGVPLYDFLKQARPEYVTNPHIQVVWEVAQRKRNNLFHQIEGLQAEEVFQAWDTESVEAWEKRILGCLNFISKQEQITSLHETSFMGQVHDLLERQAKLL